VSDRSHLFTILLTVAWFAGVALPILLSLVLGLPGKGLPLIGVVLWFVLLRVARWISPAAQADHLMRRGKYAEALALCDRALAVQGEGAWVGMRRLVWLNRRTTALIALGQEDQALVAAMDAVSINPDPETLGNCAMALLRLNRYDEAVVAGRLGLALTRERSVLCHGVLALVMLAQHKPAEAEAMAGAGLEDSRALYPFSRLERYTTCLAAMTRAIREQVRHPVADAQREYFHKTRRNGQRLALTGTLAVEEQKKLEGGYLRDLRKAAGRTPLLRAMALLEEADSLSDQPQQRERACTLLESAYQLAPEYCLWFVSQPGTFITLNDDPRLLALRTEASARFAAWNAHAPDSEVVGLALTAAEGDARARPAQQSSYQALVVQVITLGGTFALLLLWTWRFFILGS
jgi:tetratricopeptide (TPR) repeat protein